MREQEERHHPIDENMRVQRATWAAERVAWALWFLLIAATLAGFASNGPASEAGMTGPHALAVSYERFQRLTRLARFTLRAGAGPSDEVTLRLDAKFAHRYVIEAIEPPPTRARGGKDVLELAFAPVKGEASGHISIIPRRADGGQAENAHHDAARSHP